MIKEIIEVLKDDVEKIIFRMDSGYFSEEIFEVVESAGHEYVIKSKHYATLVPMVYADKNIEWKKIENDDREVAVVSMKLKNWSLERNFVVTRKKKPTEETLQESLFEYDKYSHDFFVHNTNKEPSEIVEFYAKRGNSENYIKETKYDMNIGKLKMHSFWANEAFFQIMMLVYNLFLLFKMDRTSESEYRQQIKTFRLKYVYVAAKIVKTARQTIMKLLEGYPYKEIFKLHTA